MRDYGVIVQEVVKRIKELEEQPYVPVGVSNRHLHLKKQDLEALFGTGYELTKMKDLKQPGQFAANETVTIRGPKGEIENVRILGPVRDLTQLEISLSDGFKLGIKAPVKESGKIIGTPGITLVGPKGKLDIEEGVIAALRHVHVSPSFAEQFNLIDKEMVSVFFDGIRQVTFNNVLIRVSDRFVEEMHLDTDEANAAGIGTGALGKIMKG